MESTQAPIKSPVFRPRWESREFAMQSGPLGTEKAQADFQKEIFDEINRLGEEGWEPWHLNMNLAQANPTAPPRCFVVCMLKRQKFDA